MIILITGASHTGKTLLAQKLLERYEFPYLSMDHVKMGLIRSGNTELTPYDDDRMTDYLWPIVREIIKTAIENEQHLIVEGCYVPPDWARDFAPEYLRNITLRCLVMTENYIKTHSDDLRAYGSVIERRLYEDFDADTAVAENKRFLSAFGKDENAVVLIENDYFSDLEAGLHLPEPNENSNSIHLKQEEKRMLFICYPKCTTCQKAQKWLDEHGVEYELRNIKEENPSEEELRAWHAASGLPLKRFFNTSGLQYKALELKDRLPSMSEDEQFKLLASDGMLVKRPLLIGDGFVLVGFKENEYEQV